MDQKEETKEEKVVIKVSKIELQELERLHKITNQAPNRVIGTVNLLAESKKNLLDYHEALSKKYEFNPFKMGVNRKTGEIQPIPEHMLDEVNKDNKQKEKGLKRFLKELTKPRDVKQKDE